MTNTNEPPEEQQAPPRRATTTGTATSRAGHVKAAVRKPTKARLALSGVSGAGKTWTALCIAEILAPGGNTTVIDTEPSDDLNTASELYADTFTFNIIDWREPPYDPRDLALTTRELGSLGQTDVLIVDSASAFWRGTGGTLDVAGGNFGGWKTATPAQNDLVAAFLNAPFHVIFCTRAKTEYLVEEGGRKVTKLGLAPIQRDDLEYEFQVVGMIDHEHRIDIGKTRCDDLAGKSFHANGQAELGQILKRWLDRGPELIRQYDIDLITDALKLLPRGEARQRGGQEFIAAFGKPDSMPPDRLPAVWAWLSAHVEVEPHVFSEADTDPEEGAMPKCGACSLGARAGWHQAPPQGDPPEPAAPQGDQGSGTAEEALSELQGPGNGDSEPDPGDAEGPTVEQLTEEISKLVGDLTPMQVTHELGARSLSVTGAPKTQRKRLVDAFLNYAQNLAADPLACETCDGYKTAPVIPPKGYCTCPI